jgi:hypothetical protein
MIYWNWFSGSGSRQGAECAGRAMLVNCRFLLLQWLEAAPFFSYKCPHLSSSCQTVANYCFRKPHPAFAFNFQLSQQYSPLARALSSVI